MCSVPMSEEAQCRRRHIGVEVRAHMRETEAAVQPWISNLKVLSYVGNGSSWS